MDVTQSYPLHLSTLTLHLSTLTLHLSPLTLHPSPLYLRQINTLYAFTYGSKHFVRYGFEPLSKLGNGKMVTKNFYGVTFVAGNVGHVNHADIHADVTHIGRWHAVDQTIPSAISQSAIKSVGIPNRKGGYARGT